MIGYWGYGWGPGWHIFGGILTLVVWLVVVAAIVSIIKKGFHGWGGWQHHTPLDILKERYARGEITKAQFEEMKRDIES